MTEKDIIKNFVSKAPWAVLLLPERFSDDADILRAASEVVIKALAAQTNDVA